MQEYVQYYFVRKHTYHTHTNIYMGILIKFYKYIYVGICIHVSFSFFLTNQYRYGPLNKVRMVHLWGGDAYGGGVSLLFFT